MSKKILALIAFLAPFVLVYLGIAFIFWEINPSQWRAEARMVLVGLGTMAGSFAVAGTKGLT